MPVDYLDAPPAGADVVVVGGGVVGAATAFHAARAGLHVVIVERRPALCTLTTAAAAGGYRLQLETEEELRLVQETVTLLDAFRDLTGQADYDPRVRRQGYLFCTTTEAGVARQRRLVDLQHAWGVADVELLPGEEARRRFGYLAPEVRQARYRAGDGLLDPKALTFGLVAGSRAGVLTGCAVTGLRSQGGAVTGVETTRGFIGSGVVVVAAGPLSGRVAALAGVELPVTTVRRQKVVLPELPMVPRDAPMTIDEDTAAHWRPLFGGAALLFTDPATPPSPPVEDVPLDHRFVFEVLDPASPAAVARISPFWREVWQGGAVHWLLQAGQYTMTPDRRPLIGATGMEGLFVHTGYSGHGVMAAVGGGRVLVETLTGRRSPAGNPFRPDLVFTPPMEPGPL